MPDRFLPEGFEYDTEHRVTRPCPKCGRTIYAPGPSGWASLYWLHSDTDTYACGVTESEPGCTCGGMAACPQCQDRDAAPEEES